MASFDPANAHVSISNYVSYQDTSTGRGRVGHYNFDEKTVRPLAFISGTLLNNLYQVIEAGEHNITTAGEPFPASEVRILPPFPDRDVLCVGKNYAEHAKEFNSSGFDSSDKVDTPSHPVIFTKRFTSIIADGEDVYPHPEFTQTVDYEGEIGVVVGKPGFRISEADAMSHVWGYTIVNDITARERQRDHKQFYIGKSPDTFCPMGPVAVPASKLDKVLRVQTHVNGELRQDATTEDLIFSIPFLIKTMSEGQTLMPGDVLATGTPAGVGIGRKPPVYLKPGDTMAVSVTGLGTLTNRIGSPQDINPIVNRVANVTHIQRKNPPESMNSKLLAEVNNKPMYFKKLGISSGPPVIFVHGLGGSSEYYMPLIQSLGIVSSYQLWAYDLEGHGLSPTSPLSVLSIESFAADLNGLFEVGDIPSNATIVAHSIGCLIAVRFALAHPEKVQKLILLGPPSSPFDINLANPYALADSIRTNGIACHVNDSADASTSQKTKTSNPLAIAAVRMSLLAQDPEGYAKAWTALGDAPRLDFSTIRTKTLIVTGSEDYLSPPHLCEKYMKEMNGKASLRVLEDVGHWHVFEHLEEVSKVIRAFL
ncbi:hypothetical protein G6011_09907 [Alternaria panax]|uniref:Fumarylacetoacetate hydrolase-like protein n=1 Tax=Alternaria panax TaxID=48097 RepID=A0AAD4FFY3_9PLEO|nr:hypothetical protein G6011_09907 [Alternaria panax]